MSTLCEFGYFVEKGDRRNTFHGSSIFSIDFRISRNPSLISWREPCCSRVSTTLRAPALGTGLLDHIHVSEDEACFGALGVKTSLERADETEVGVFAQALGRVGHGVVE